MDLNGRKWLLVILCVVLATTCAWLFLHEGGGPRSSDLPRGDGPARSEEAPEVTFSSLSGERASVSREKSSEAEVAERSIAVRVQRTDGRGIGRAGLLIGVSGAAVMESECDEDGVALLRLPEGRRACLIASARGFARGEHEIGPEHVGPVTIVLPPAGSILGSVRWFDGAPLGKGIRVAGWPVHSPPTPRALRLFHDGVPTLLLTQTDEDGLFRLDGAIEGVRYEITCAGSSSVAVERSLAVAGAGEEVHLILVPVLATQLVIEHDGSAPLTSAGCAGREGIHWSFTSPLAAHSLGGRQPEWALLSLSPLEQRSWDRKLYAFSVHARVDRVGPIRLEGSIPGYARFETSFWAYPLEGGLHRKKLEIERIADGWGSLEISFLGGLQGLFEAFDVERLHPSGTVELLAANGERYFVAASFTRAESSTATVLPVGEYLARFDSSNGLWGYPEEDGRMTVTVGPGATTRLAIPAYSMGALRLTDVRAKDGTPHKGPVALRLDYRPIGGSTSRQSTWHFAQEPYLLDALPAGEYVVGVVGPEPRGWHGSTSAVVSVGSDVITTVSLSSFLPASETRGR